MGEFEEGANFWQHYSDRATPYREELELFIEKFCFKVVSLYLYKIRFILALEIEGLISVTIKNLLNPHGLFNQVFCPGGGQELVCKSLQHNIYSWYHPSQAQAQVLGENAPFFGEISNMEMMELATFNHSSVNRNQLERSKHSVAISHKSFGTLLKNLMILLPLWKEMDKFDYPISSGDPKILNTKFIGDYAISLAHSHLLAEEQDINSPWSQILCPHFAEDGFENGEFLQYCQELQFLTFLATYAKKYDTHSLRFIAEVMRKKYHKSDDKMGGQPSLLYRYDLKKELLYDRIVLNLIHIPAKNTHHFLLGKIQQQKKSLSEKGQIIILSNQRLFVPGQGSKVAKLLEDFNFELHIDLKSLVSKGEIPNYIYVLSLDQTGGSLDKGEKNYKNTVVQTFRWRGHLSSFDKFNLYVEELINFFCDKCPLTTPVYQKDLEQELCFEFHQDAIFEGGILLSSSVSDASRSSITHPNFFKGLTRSCSPFDQFFFVKQLDFTPKGRLGMGLQGEESFPLILVVNYSDARQITLEIIPSNSYRAKLEHYGCGSYHYFGLIPKNPGLNINLFRELFATDLGRQIVQLSLQGGIGKLKTKLKSILIPNYFAHSGEIPDLFRGKDTILNKSLEELKGIHPAKMAQQWGECRPLFEDSSKLSPWAKMSILTSFKFQLEGMLEKSSSTERGINFDSSTVKDALGKLKPYPIYPANEDIFVEFIPAEGDSEWIHLPLKEVFILGESGHYALSLVGTNGETIARLHSEESFLQFAHYLLSLYCGHPISSLIKNLSLPRLDKFKEVLQNCSTMDRCLGEISKDLAILINHILTVNIAGR